MPDVISNAAVDVRLWVALDVHKLSIVAAILPPKGGQPDVQQIETTRAAIRRFIDRLGGPEGLADRPASCSPRCQRPSGAGTAEWAKIRTRPCSCSWNYSLAGGGECGRPQRTA
ncbi:MAG: hypothetical protein ACYC91_18705 [Solirubrobacteraceae bacterium]